ncbi:MAG TPA: metalloregulator ArsR/SmtB family transcription factor [Gemmatimonadaceae bacterium]|nr:metalloregulator ArsR/SmtB family transcription factor [Gemmatimonadaceae bacterium]
MPIDHERFARIAKALADPRRFQILEEIANCREVGCQRLCEQFPVAQPTMSHHLKELARAGLIEPWREGQFAFYRFRDDVLQEYLHALEDRLGMEVTAIARRVAEGPPREGDSRLGRETRS